MPRGDRKPLRGSPCITSGWSLLQTPYQALWIAISSFQAVALLFVPSAWDPLSSHCSGIPWSRRDVFLLAPTDGTLTSLTHQHHLGLDPSHGSGKCLAHSRPSIKTC